MIDFNSRTKALTNAEFRALPRNVDGDILDLSLAYPFITNEQRDLLSGDDLSRIDDLDEELRIMIAELAEEFGM